MHILVHLVQKLPSGAFPDTGLPRESTQPKGNGKFGGAPWAALLSEWSSLLA